MKPITDVLRDAIRKDGRGINALARDSGVDAAVYSRLLHGLRDPTIRTADKMCVTLGLELRPVEPGRKQRKR